MHSVLLLFVLLTAPSSGGCSLLVSELAWWWLGVVCSQGPSLVGTKSVGPNWQMCFPRNK